MKLDSHELKKQTGQSLNVDMNIPRYPAIPPGLTVKRCCLALSLCKVALSLIVDGTLLFPVLAASEVRWGRGVLAEWVASDGLLRTDDEFVRCMLEELPFNPLGARIRERLEGVVRQVTRTRRSR